MLMRKRVEIKMYIVFGLILAPVVVFGVILSSDYVSADESAGVNASVNVPASCTMSGSGTSSHTATLINGTYTPGIGTTTVNVTCNDAAGFSIYAAGFTGNEVGADNSNKLVGTAASGNATINTGTATGPSINYDVSNWAMKLEADSYGDYPVSIENSFDYYHEVPIVFTKVATRLTGTDVGTGATGATFTSTYAAYISKEQPTDSYSGQVKFVMVHPNNADIPGSFAAAYRAAGKTKYNGYYKMQDMNDTICANVYELESATLIDTRDNNTYTVAKLADACWMTQNLRITGVVPAEGSNFTGNDYNVSAYDLKTDGTSGGACHWKTGGDDNPCSHIPDSSDLSRTGLTAQQIGVWYNYAAATAGQITGESNTDLATQDICPAGWHLPYFDPAGWNDTEYVGPHGSINSLVHGRSWVYPSFDDSFLPVTGGYFNVGSIQNIGNGNWWSTTANWKDNRYGLLFSTWPGFHGSVIRSWGVYIRCVR